MRKRTLSYIAEKLMWLIIVMLPFLMLVCIWAKNGNTATSLADVMQYFGISDNNVIYTSLTGLFGTGGVMEFFNTPDFMLYFTYFVIVEIVHLAVDFLVFIPRLAHKFLNSFTRSDD